MTGARSALPTVVSDARGHFSRALVALSLCEDVAVAAGSSTARAYVAGAAGAVRHALAALATERGTRWENGGTEAFDMLRVGSSQLIGGPDGWDTASRCRLPDGGEGTVRALVPASEVEAGIWLRLDPAFPGLWARGSLEITPAGLRFVDDGDREVAAIPRIAHDLGRDLLAQGLDDLSSAPAFAAAMEVTLVSGSWCHAASGSRWFADEPTARSIVRMMGGTAPIAQAHGARLRGVIERQALIAIERAGWRHVPTPTIG